jgi:hypothetical protein
MPKHNSAYLRQIKMNVQILGNAVPHLHAHLYRAIMVNPHQVTRRTPVYGQSC